MTSVDATATGRERGSSERRLQEPLDALNRHDLDAATRCVNTERCRENCVAFTPGCVGWEGSKHRS